MKRRIPAPAKSASRAVMRAVAVASSPMRTDPDFLIIGAKRSGTTTLWNAMLEHPDVMPMFPAWQEIKSPHYFDINYSRGISWYRSHFPTSAARHRHRRRTGNAPISGEASPYYLFHPLAAQRIQEALPDVRLIVSLRNPVDRIWSHYRERLGSKTETLSFDEALAAEPGRLAGEADRIVSEEPDYYSFHHDLSSYLARGRYAEQLRPYTRLFGERLLILKAEDFYTDPQSEMAKAFEFLRLRTDIPLTVRRYNRLPTSSMPDSTRKLLVQYYDEPVRELQQLLDRDFGWPDFTR